LIYEDDPDKADRGNDRITGFTTCATRATIKTKILPLAQPAQPPNDKFYRLRNPRNHQNENFTACAACATTE
jgi:hypothetical protein